MSIAERLEDVANSLRPFLKDDVVITSEDNGESETLILKDGNTEVHLNAFGNRVDGSYFTVVQK